MGIWSIAILVILIGLLFVSILGFINFGIDNERLRNENKKIKSNYVNYMDEILILRRQVSNLKNSMNNNQNQSTSSGITWLDVFGFSPTQKITKDMISDRYRALAKIYHPDITGDDFAMKRLNRAKELADKKFP